MSLISELQLKLLTTIRGAPRVKLCPAISHRFLLKDFLFFLMRLLIKYTSVITFPWGLLLSVLETMFAGGNSPPPPLPYLTRESANILFTSRSDSSVLLNEAFLHHLLTYGLHLHGFR